MLDLRCQALSVDGGLGIDVGLAVAFGVEMPADRVVAPAGDKQFLGWVLRDDLAPGRGDDDLLLDPGGAPAVVGWPVGLQREHHAGLECLWAIERCEPAEDRSLPDA